MSDQKDVKDENVLNNIPDVSYIDDVEREKKILIAKPAQTRRRPQPQNSSSVEKTKAFFSLPTPALE